MEENVIHLTTGQGESFSFQLGLNMLFQNVGTLDAQLQNWLVGEETEKIQ